MTQEEQVYVFSAKRQEDGSWELSALVSGYRVTQVYCGYTLLQAKNRFIKYIKAIFLKAEKSLNRLNLIERQVEK